MNPHEISCTKAAEFIETLRLSNSLWSRDGEWSSEWIFRGEKKQERPPTPKAWRRHADSEPAYRMAQRSMPEGMLVSMIKDLKQHASYQSVPEDRVVKLFETVYAEHRGVEAFANLVDGLGMPLHRDLTWKFPDSNVLASPRCDSGYIDYYPEPFDSCFALARHHGVFSRLLDWTRNPLFAAFFAIDQPCECNHNADSEPDNTNESGFAVWALNTRLKPEKVRLFTTPRSHVGFLHAQDGLFTYIGMANRHFVLTGEWPTIEGEYRSKDGDSRDHLVKITLSGDQRDELRRLLWIEGVSRARLMPTLDNVRQELDSLWDKTAS